MIFNIPRPNLTVWILGFQKICHSCHCLFRIWTWRLWENGATRQQKTCARRARLRKSHGWSTRTSGSTCTRARCAGPSEKFGECSSAKAVSKQFVILTRVRVITVIIHCVQRVLGAKRVGPVGILVNNFENEYKYI